MITHDVLAFGIASEAVRRIRQADAEWSPVFSANVYPSSSRTWPLPDFVLVDEQNGRTAAAEFKPPGQTKREYLTGLGQAMSYTRDFDYALLIVPDVADDGYAIAEHIHAVLQQDIALHLPISLLRYNPRTISPTAATFDVLRRLALREGPAPQNRPAIESSFYAKWRDISPTELGLFLEYLYEESRRVGGRGTIRDRAFARLWTRMVAHQTFNWSGTPRTVNPDHSVAWGKNYRNFVMHIGWAAPDGRLTEPGLEAWRMVFQYGADSRLFLDQIAKAVLLGGKHLVLINAINEFQDGAGAFDEEAAWLDAVELHLETEGLLKRNPGRHDAAARGVARGFLKAEKTLWKNLELIIPRGPGGGRVYHPGRGFIFNWARITSLLTQD